MAAIASGITLTVYTDKKLENLDAKIRITMACPVYDQVNLYHGLELLLNMPVVDEYAGTLGDNQRKHMLQENMRAIESNPDFSRIETTYNERLELYNSEARRNRFEAFLGLGSILFGVVRFTNRQINTEKLQ